jgi:hypothetical protein
MKRTFRRNIRGHLLIELAAALVLFGFVATGILKSFVSSAQTTAIAADITTAIGTLDNYQELFRAADISTNGNSIGLPIVPVASANLFTIPANANTWGSKSTSITSPVSGTSFPVTTYFQWRTPITKAGGLRQVEYHVAIEMPQPDLPGMENTNSVTSKPFRWERVILRTF